MEVEVPAGCGMFAWIDQAFYSQVKECRAFLGAVQRAEESKEGRENIQIHSWNQPPSKNPVYNVDLFKIPTFSTKHYHSNKQPSNKNFFQQERHDTIVIELCSGVFPESSLRQ